MEYSEIERGTLLAAYLCGCALRGDAPEPDRVRADDLKLIYGCAKRQMMTALAAHALASAGVCNKNYERAEARAIKKAVTLDALLARVADELESRGIFYLPLKGAVLKALYPAVGLRQMTDVDVLVDPSRRADVRAAMEQVGFTCAHYGSGVHDIYTMEPSAEFEMHVALFSPKDPVLHAYYADVADRMIPDGGFARRLSDEDFYIYMTAHEFHHYSGRGAGVRSLADAFVFLRAHPSLDRRYVDGELDKLGVRVFEKTRTSLAFKLFADSNVPSLTDSESDMLARYVKSGYNGSDDIAAENTIEKQGGTGYLRRRIFVPPEDFRESHPFIYRHRFLHPVHGLIRIGRAATSGRRRTVNELKHYFRKKRRPPRD